MRKLLIVLVLALAQLASAQPNDTNYSTQWHLNNTGQSGGTADADIDAPEAWGVQTGSSSVVVAVLGAGCDYNHVDLAGNILLNTADPIGNGDEDSNGFVDDYYGWDFWGSGTYPSIVEDNNPMDVHANGHDTLTSGIISAVTNNATGVAGVGYNVKILCIKFQTSQPVGTAQTFADAIDYAILRGADIISTSALMSAGWPTGAGYSQVLYDAIERARDAGILVVCTTGNSTIDLDANPAYPAAFLNDNIIAVAATDHNDVLTSWSNYGLKSVDLAAPGGSVVNYTDTRGIYGLDVSNGYQYGGGTSFATPIVAGVAALLKSQNPTWTYKEIRRRIFNTVDPLASLSGKTVTGGRVNAYSALSFTPDTHAASTCSYADVSAAVAAASNEDTVTIPAGDCTWTTQLNITKGIHLQGAGEGVTTLRDNVTKDGSDNSRLMKVTVDSPNRFEISNMTLVGVANDPSIYNLGHIYMGGTQTQFRVHDITVSAAKTSIIRSGNGAYGLIDNVSYTSSATGKNLLLALMPNWGDSSYGDGSWFEPIYWGSEKAIYVEDCTLIADGNPTVTNFFDGFEGARVVLRHNYVEQGNFTSHGTDSGQRRRGIRQMEVYNNQFVFPAGMPADFITWIRGGTGVWFGNTVTAPGGVNQCVKALNCRDGTQCGTPTWPPWGGACDGNVAYDENQPGETGYRCVDQPGSGTSNHLNGQATPTAEWVGNINDPIYEWNNTCTSTFGKITGSTHVQSNRDFYLGTQRPGYTAYTYPHPLRGETQQGFTVRHRSSGVTYRGGRVQ